MTDEIYLGQIRIWNKNNATSNHGIIKITLFTNSYPNSVQYDYLDRKLFGSNNKENLLAYSTALDPNVFDLVNIVPSLSDAKLEEIKVAITKEQANRKLIKLESWEKRLLDDGHIVHAIKSIRSRIVPMPSLIDAKLTCNIYLGKV